ncbi:MAG: hypothetical protein DCC55_10250 [Chloroflexi bacterium]|nr:MAG: hypothetical protein DCC55_10250 [Chloroflexota bacterium]
MWLDQPAFNLLLLAIFALRVIIAWPRRLFVIWPVNCASKMMQLHRRVQSWSTRLLLQHDSAGTQNSYTVLCLKPAVLLVQKLPVSKQPRFIYAPVSHNKKRISSAEG